jgi:hypothetical protein
VVTPDALKHQLRNRILAEAIDAAVLAGLDALAFDHPTSAHMVNLPTVLPAGTGAAPSTVRRRPGEDRPLEVDACTESHQGFGLLWRWLLDWLALVCS